ncbi:MAG TPA: Ig-like domain-containing protein, partial [Gemmataceae bacterium]|nr:Ig-like domain-containing protein [Gemmataceae bacterium]
SVTITTAPEHGTATVDPATGEVTYMAFAGFNDTDKFQYTITDDAGATSAPGTVTVVGATATGVNDDFADTDGTNPVTVHVLANDVGVGGMVPGSVRISRAPAGGRVTVDPETGAITYTASTTFAGTDTFRYTARDASGHFGSATVSIRINRPVAADDWVDTDGTNSVTINVLENDTDPDGNQHIDYPGSVIQVSSPAHGTVRFDAASNSFSYTAFANFAGTDSFQYVVTDDAGAASLPATVFVRVNRPVAADDFAIAHGTNSVTINVLENDTDPDGNEHIDYTGSVTQISGPAHGTVTFDPLTNSFTYTAFAGFTGTDSFRYIVTDDAGASSLPATVRISVEAPFVLSTSAAVTGSTTIDIRGLASHPEGNAALASFAVVTPPEHGHLTIDAVHWTITYVADAGYSVPDTFAVKVTDIYGVVSDVGTITLSVTAAV